MEPQPVVPLSPTSPSKTAPVPTSPHSKLPIVLISLIVLVSVGAGGVFLGQRLAKPAVAPAPVAVVPTPTPDPTANWKLYANNDLTFKYPSDWKEIGTGRFEGGINSAIMVYAVGKDSTLMNECMKQTSTQKSEDIFLKKFTRINTGEMCALGTDDVHDRETWIIPAENSYSPGLSFRYSHEDTSAPAIFDQILSTFQFTD